MRKKLCFIIVIMLFLSSLIACSEKTNDRDPNDKIAVEEAESTVESEVKETIQTQEGAKTEVKESEMLEVEEAAQSLALQKQFYGLYEWDSDALLVESEFSHITLANEAKAAYPELADTLKHTASMIKNSMEDEFDNLCAFAREDIEGDEVGIETSVSTLDIQVRRADSTVISLLSDSYSDYGRIEEFRGMYGTNYDSQTGQEIKLSDVIKDMSEIPAIVLNELNSHMWAGEFYSDTVVEEYFTNTPEDGISWTLDYNGVTFYFADGELAEQGNGRQTATVSFSQYPELFEEKYMMIPDAYMVELPMNSSYFTDLDDNGDLEELNVTGFFDSDMGFYTEYGIYTDTDGYFHYEECFADGFWPYYVKTADGNHYIYLFCEENEGAVPMFSLHVIKVNDGKFTTVGSMHVGPGYIPTGIYQVPTDPKLFYLDDFESMAQDMMAYKVGATGLPVLAENEQASASEGYAVTVSSAEELLEAIGPNVGILIKPGYYNLSEYIEDMWAAEGEEWNARHPYVQLRECWDGVEVVIRRVDGLSIFGDNENKTEIVIEPRYGQVFNFEECYNIFLSGLTMGHTQTGECSGNVLDFSGCRNITLSAMDLYGCGVYGIGSYDGTGEMYVYSSTIRDCSYGALEIIDGVGRFEFHDSMLTGSEAYDRYEKSPYSELAFYNCVFGENETSYYMFLDDIYTEDCVWSENYTYPEYGFDSWLVFEPETMENAVVDKTFLDSTSWAGYAMVNPESGETVYLPYTEADGTETMVSLKLEEDGTGWFEQNNEYSSITWTCDEDSFICITLEGGPNYYMTPYTMAGEGYIWLLLELENCLVWLY